MIRKGNKMKAARDITWGVVLGIVAPATIIDRVLVPSGTIGKIAEYNDDGKIYLVKFENDQEWWLSKKDIDNVTVAPSAK